MLTVFNKIAYAEYRTRLKNAFPKTIESDVEAVLNIIPLDNHKIKSNDGKIHQTDSLIHQSHYVVNLNQEQLIIPFRLYFNEPDPTDETKLTERQRAILNCIYLRHHDGYLRQKRLELLLNYNESWVPVFTLQLLGEYVYQLIPILDKHVNDNTMKSYADFVRENPKYWQKTENRIYSYWNEYYRDRFPKVKDYPGRHLADRINKAIA